MFDVAVIGAGVVGHKCVIKIRSILKQNVIMYHKCSKMSCRGKRYFHGYINRIVNRDCYWYCSSN